MNRVRFIKKRVPIWLLCLLLIVPACASMDQGTGHAIQVIPLVTIKVKIAVDNKYINISRHNDWKERARERIMDLSSYFEKEFAIRLDIISIDKWDHGHNFSNYSLLPKKVRDFKKLGLFRDLILAERLLGESDLLIGISGSNMGGVAEHYGKYMLVGTPKHRRHKGSCGVKKKQRSYIKHIDRHELGHIFGLTNKDYGSGSVMGPDSRSIKFNNLEKNIIIETKIKKFESTLN